MRRHRIMDWLGDESGASLIEYSLLVGLISIAIVLAVLSIATSLGSIWSALAGIIAQAAG